MTLLRWTAAALLCSLAGCAGGSDPIENDETDTAASEADPTTMTAGPSTSTTTSSTTSTSTSTTSTSTTTAADDSSSTGGSSSTGAGEGDTSTGADCPAGLMGCACDETSDPECEAGTLCSRAGICEATACGMQKDEPNGDPFEPGNLGDFSDDDDPAMFASQLDGDTDVDWWRYTCSDSLLGSLDPNFAFTLPETGRVCVFLDCQQGGNPTFDCPAGTEPANAPIDNLPGCCVVDADTFEIDNHNCPDSSNDAVDVYLRVDMGAEDACTAYDAMYGC